MIEVSCTSCGKLLKARDELAGRTAKCPQCGEPVRLPGDDQILDAEDFDEDEEDRPEPRSRARSSGRRSLIACPECGESISASAVRCPFCREDFLGSPLERTKQIDEMNVGLWLLCFCPGIGCIVGLVLLCTGRTKTGGTMMATSFGIAIVYNVLAALARLAAH